MVELIAKSACGGMANFEVKGCRLQEVEHGIMHLLSPYSGKVKALSDAMKATHGIAFPANGRSTAKAGARCVWFGMDQAMLIGVVPDTSLFKYASVVDQSDSWAVVRLQGDLAVEVLSRLTPLDLRPSGFKRGHTARSSLQHMNVSISRVGAQAFEIMALRSMAQVLVDDLKAAMLSMAAQR